MDEKITRNIEEYALENTEEVRNARNYLLRGQQVDEESFRKAGYEKLLELAQGSLNAVKKVLKVNGEKTALVQRRKRARAYTELEERVITEIAEHFKTNREVVGLDTEFVNDLGAESLDTIELQFDYEEWYDLPEKEDLWEDIVSVADLVQTIIKYGKYKK